MSLYNNVLGTLADQGLIASVQSGIQNGIAGAGKAVAGALGGGALANAVTSTATKVASQQATQLFNKYVPDTLRQKIDTGARVLGSAMKGDWESAGMAALEGGVFDKLLGGLSADANQAAIMRKRTPMLGGGSMSNTRDVMEKVLTAGHVHKNLFLLEVSSFREGDASSLFNLFAVDVDYDPFNIAGDKQRVGGATVDRVNGQEAVEMRFTTFDNQAGELKKFWARHHAAAVARDGTVGVPANYAIRIKLMHGIVEGGAAPSSAYADEGLFRVQTMSVSNSRREPGLQELQMTFSQLDSFMKA